MTKKQTGRNAARAASAVPASPRTGARSKTAAASALTQTDSASETTSARAARAASSVLRDGRTSAASKSAAGSALAQTERRARKKK